MINRVVLVGRLTRDVEVRKTASGLSVASFMLACGKRMSRDRETSGQQTADFLRCVAWGQSAEFLGAYAKKGALVGVDGRLQSHSYDDKDGKRVYVTEVVCDNVQLLESKAVSQNRAASPPEYNFRDSYREPAMDNYSRPDDFGRSGSQSGYDDAAGLNISSDDLPF